MRRDVSETIEYLKQGEPARGGNTLPAVVVPVLPMMQRGSARRGWFSRLFAPREEKIEDDTVCELMEVRKDGLIRKANLWVAADLMLYEDDVTNAIDTGRLANGGRAIVERLKQFTQLMGSVDELLNHKARELAQGQLQQLFGLCPNGRNDGKKANKKTD